MNYFISRAGQQYGPYSLDEVQRYVASGNILVSDLARSEAMEHWAPVSQVVGNIPTQPVPPPPGQAQVPVYVQPQPQPPLYAQPAPPNYKPPKSRLAFILLGIFLGGLGIHNFYAGYTGKGLAQLLISVLTCGVGSLVVWVWVIVELCTVDKDSENVYFN